MSTQLFNVTLKQSTLPGQALYPKLATTKLNDPVLQPVIEKKGCEKVLSSMKECLVETHSWESCGDQVKKFQDCINVRYFEEVVEAKDEILNQEDVAEDEVSKDIDIGEKSESNSLEVVEVSTVIDITENSESNICEVVDEVSADIDTKFKEGCNQSDNFEAAEVEESKDTSLNDDVCEGQKANDELAQSENGTLDDESFHFKIVPKDEKKDSEELLFKISVKSKSSG